MLYQTTVQSFRGCIANFILWKALRIHQQGAEKPVHSNSNHHKYYRQYISTIVQPTVEAKCWQCGQAGE